ncbi:hypothetical protein GCM10022221_23360 [Actinocorallia aurea]
MSSTKKVSDLVPVCYFLCVVAAFAVGVVGYGMGGWDGDEHKLGFVWLIVAAAPASVPVTLFLTTPWTLVNAVLVLGAGALQAVGLRWLLRRR